MGKYNPILEVVSECKEAIDTAATYASIAGLALGIGVETYGRDTCNDTSKPDKTRQGGEQEMPLTEDQEEYVAEQGEKYVDKHCELVEEIGVDEEEDLYKVVGLALEFQRHERDNGPQVGRRDIWRYALERDYFEELGVAAGAIAGDSSVEEIYKVIGDALEEAGSTNYELALQLLERDIQTRQLGTLLEQHTEGLESVAETAEQVDIQVFETFLRSTKKVSEEADEAYREAVEGARTAHNALVDEEEGTEE